MALSPEFIILDEPTAALDVSVQAQITLLLQQLRDALNMTCLFISHDLSLVDYFCHRIIVMYLGCIVEISPANFAAKSPRHPYTLVFMDSVFVVDPKSRKDIVGLEGEVTKAFNLSGACVFRDRCQYAKVLCHRQSPQLVEASPGEFVACHFLLR